MQHIPFLFSAMHALSMLKENCLQMNKQLGLNFKFFPCSVKDRLIFFKVYFNVLCLNVSL